MRALTVRNKTRGRILGERIRLADTFLNRLRGLAGAGMLERGEGLLLSPCRAVHTVGCVRALDVVFIDRRGSVVAMYADLRPMRVTRWVGGAEYALELPAGTISSTGTQVRDRLAWVPSPGSCVDPTNANPYEGWNAAGTRSADGPRIRSRPSSREAKNAGRES